MTKSQYEDLDKDLALLRQFSVDILGSIKLLRWIGSGLLILALFELIDIVYPPQLMNPAWELQTIGRIVEWVPIPLIGLALVFHGTHYLRTTWERPVLKFLSWAALLFGVFCWLLIPLGLADTVRLETQNNQNVGAAVNQRLDQVKTIQKQLQAVQTTSEMEQLLNRLNRQNLTPTLAKPQGLKIVKEQLTNSIAKTEATILNQGTATRSQQNGLLLKNSLRWNLGALVAGVLLINVWRVTSWARLRKK
jgi:hypothetical protein